MADALKWTTQQQQCITDRGGTILVSAAAGSGKTAVLVNRLVGRITDAEHPVDVDRLLVVTFTNAAAAEMKQRIAKELTKLLRDDPQNRRLQRQQLALPRASISTVHAFCIELLRNNAYLLNLSPQFKIGEEQQLLLLRREALTEVLEECYTEKTEEFTELTDMLSNGKHDLQLSSTVEAIYEFIQSYPHPEEWLTFAASIYDTTLSPAQTPWGQLFTEHIRHTFEGFHSLLLHAANLCDGDEQLTLNYLPSLQTDIAALAEHIAALQTNPDWDTVVCPALAFSLTPLISIRKPTDTAAQNRIKELRGSIEASLKSIRNLYCGNGTQCREDIAATRRLVTVLYDMVSRFSKRFSEKKRAQQWMDFNDLEHFTLQLLTQRQESGEYVPSKLAEELSLQYDEIMVDEYQDTNATQNAIFTALSRKEKNLFLVGDVKQSIYGFRQARPELFIHRRTAYAPYDGTTYPATITLGNNFRSRREVTDTVNFLFRQLMSPSVGGLAYGDEEELKFSAKGYPDSDDHATECLIVDAASIKEAAVSSDVAEARVIAKRIQELRGTLSVTKDGVTRPAEYGDFCILLRAKQTHAEAFRKELENWGIPVTVDTERAFFANAEIRLALALLRTVDNPTLDIPLAAVMLSPLFRFTPDDLAYLRRGRPTVCLYSSVCAARKDTRRPALSRRCAEFVKALERYRTLAATLTVDVLLRRLYEETALPDLMATRKGGAARRENLQLLYEHCARFEQNGFRGLSAFIRYVDRLQEQQSDLPGASAGGTADAVHIMSIHGSKGLEFPVVFLARLDGAFNNRSSQGNLLLHPKWGAALKRRDPQSFNRYVTLPYCGLSLAIRNSDRAEEMRILYVALTRAREKLILVTSPSSLAKKLPALAAGLGTEEAIPLSTVYSGNSYSQWILTALLRHPGGDELRRLGGNETLSLLPAQAPCRIAFYPVPEEAIATNTNTFTATADPALAQAIREKMAYEYPHWDLAAIPSKLAASETAHTALSHAFVARSRPAFLSQSGLTPAERGTAMHTFMQYASYSAAAASVEEEAARLVAGGFLTAAQKEALNVSKLSAFFRSQLYRRMTASPHLLREYHFTCRQPVAGHPEEFTVLQGIADCVFEENGALVIVDYKTDRVNSEQELAQRYRPQLTIYRQALTEALGLPVSSCLLYSFALGHAVSVDTTDNEHLHIKE